MYSIAIPSYNRPTVETLAAIAGLPKEVKRYVFVNDKEEAKLYRANMANASAQVTSLGCKRGIQYARNAILDYFPKGAEIVTLCDDVESLQTLDPIGDKLRLLTPKEWHQLILGGFDQAHRYGTKLWGVYPVANHFYMSWKVSTKAFIIGTFSGIIVSDIRHDERLELKEDYDFSLKHIHRYSGVIRYNNICVKAKHYKNKGGCVGYRTTEKEQNAIRILKSLYPKNVVDNPRRENEILLKFSKVK
jgi:hypothetical protein